MAKRLTVVVTVMQDGRRGRVEKVRVLLRVKGVRGWPKAKQTRLSNLLADYARNEKGR